MKMVKKFLLVFGILIVGALLSSEVSASFGGPMSPFSGSTNNWQSYQPTFDRLYSGQMGDFWPIFNQMENDQCNATSDFIIGIPPGGCTPSVVRSDLLEEQNVPVFCQLYAIKVNPLIKVSSIKSIYFKNKPEGVSSIVFHPARAAVKSYTTLLGDPTLNNIGYVVIILKRERVEGDIAEWIAGNLTATIHYDAEEAYGTGASEYYLPFMSEEDWDKDYAASSFWNGRGYLRTTSVGDGKARVQILTSKDKVIRTLNLKEGETSNLMYLPGYYCRAGLKVKLNNIVAPEDKALLNIDGQTFWVREGTKFLNGKCSVTALDVNEVNNDGEIKIRCDGVGNLEPLSLKKKGANFEVDGKIIEYHIRDKITIEKKEKYLVSYGEIESKEFVVLADKMPENSVVKSILEKRDLYNDFEKFKGEVKDIKGIKGLSVISAGNENFKGLVGGVKEDEYEKKEEDKSSESLVEEYFGLANKTVSELVKTYSSEEKENGETFGEEALYEQIKLAGDVGKFKTKADLMDLFIKEYPSSKIVEQIRSDMRKLKVIDFSNSFTSVYVIDKFHSISVVDFKPVEEGERKVGLKIGGKINDSLNEDDEINLSDDRKLVIKEILPGKVKLTFDSTKKDVSSWTGWVSEGKTKVFDGIEVYVRDVEVNEVAHISLIPEVKHTKTEANFTFRIGIEKRAIELSPERAEKMLKNINESIVRWEEIVDKLGNVITGLKGACFATSGILMIKNMASGFSGGAMARQEVMKEYKEICDKDKSYDTRTECYNDLSEEIEKAVADMTAVLKGVNEDMAGVMEDNTVDSGGLFGRKGIGNSTKYREDLRNKIGKEDILVNVGRDVISVPIERIDTESSLRAVMTWKKAKEVGGISEDVAKAKMDIALRNIALKKKQDVERKNVADKLMEGWGNVNVGEGEIVLLTNEKTIYHDWAGKKGSYYKLEDGYKDSKVQIVSTTIDESYLVVLAGVSKDGSMGVDKVYDRVEGVWSSVEVPDSLKNVVFSSRISSRSCSNSWMEGKAEVSYYESGDNKGLPAIVPFDLKEGWYASISNSGGTILDNSPQGYTASADVRHFNICNIGKNSLMDNGEGDDLCQSFNVNTLGVVDEFCGLSSSELKKLYSCARQAIQQVSEQRDSSSIRIRACMNEEIILDRGKPQSQVGGFECQDFMSPADCKLMFNVCDPVICPPSRCDFGGKMKVSDVIQTGIIGSLTLCLPNAKEGVAIPICLSGVHAGLEAYLSILRSEADCLQHSLDTGEVVGICDEITSIYKCEFFWKQLSPMIDQLVPGIIGGIVSPGSGVRGGGEYALVQQSWNVMRQSVSHFKNVYAQNAFRAFNIRSTEEVGSTFCKAFVGTSVPGSADFLDSLLKPESPSQFYAQFSETPFTEATVPATSQYKIYYHIYAGNDRGVQYKIYLKDPPETSYYRANPSVYVRSAYIAKGSSADETIDFTAPAGYQNLCVVIDAKEECGFKQVTTDFGLNYVKMKYVEEQAEKSDITTEKECISGNPSALSMVNLNLQAGAEELVNPEIALRGIVRVCASVNPTLGVVSEGYVSCNEKGDCGKGFDCSDKSGYCEYVSDSGVIMQRTSSRWKEVGYCGDSSMRCWLDVDSVKDDLEMLEAIDGKPISILDERRDLIENERLSLEQVQENLASVRERIKGFKSSDLENPFGGKVNKSILELDDIIGCSTLDGYEKDSPGAGTNRDRAEALALKATIYRMVVMETIKKEIVKIIPFVKDGKVGDMVPDVKPVEEKPVEKEKEVEKKEEGVGNVLVVKQSSESDIYFRYEGGENWMWSLDKENWMVVSIVKVSGGVYDGRRPVPKNIEIIVNLKGKDYLGGVSEIEKGSEEYSLISELEVYDESLSEIRNKILTKCEELDRELVNTEYTNCFSAVEHIYGGINCIYSDIANKFYSISGGNIITEDVNEGYITYPTFAVNPSGCESAGGVIDLSEEEKLGMIESGDLLSIVFDEETGHSVIFIEWFNEEEGVAKIFDWNGENEDGKRVYRYKNYDLSDNAHPVYMAWKPVIR